MAKYFGILTAITLLFSAWLAYKNKSMYQAGIERTATEKSNLEKNRGRLQKAQSDVNSAEGSQKATEEEIAKLGGESTKEKKAIEDLKLKIETKTAEVQSNKEQLDNVRQRTEDIGDLKELAGKMRELSDEREELIQLTSSAEARLANLTSQGSNAESRVTALRGKLDVLSTGQSVPTLNTRIRSVYPTWGFVTLAAGNNAGVVANSTLNVLRSGEKIAELLVTAVERGTASANVVPDSIAADVTLQAGDQVVAAPKSERK